MVTELSYCFLFFSVGQGAEGSAPKGNGDPSLVYSRLRLALLGAEGSAPKGNGDSPGETTLYMPE